MGNIVPEKSPFVPLPPSGTQEMETTFYRSGPFQEESHVKAILQLFIAKLGCVQVIRFLIHNCRMLMMSEDQSFQSFHIPVSFSIVSSLM